MKTISLDINNAKPFAEAQLAANEAAAVEAVTDVNTGRAAGNDFLGWVNLPSSIDAALLDSINKTADRLKANCDYVVCIGIGGSYLGAKAVITALSNNFADLINEPSAKSAKVLYAGQNIGEEYTAELQDFLKGKKFGIVVISKSGTTTEPAIAFRLLKAQLEEQVGKEVAKDLIVAVTDEKKGALRTLATQEGYETYVIPDNVGGRFSVLTPVGLLPIAVAGFDICRLVAGAAEMEKDTAEAGPDNIAEIYARMRLSLIHI